MSAVYVHVPFCSQRCSYCDFYFVTSTNLKDDYLRAFEQEVVLRSEAGWDRRPIQTLYFGGGTPSLLAPADIQGMVAAVHEALDLSVLRETTLELNPENGSPAYLEAIRHAGIDRLSIGVQSFDEEILRFMKRSHDARDAQRVIGSARSAGFDNFSVDLIFGIPGQSDEDWLRTLDTVLDYNVPHLSIYGLTIEPKTLLNRWVEQGHVEPAGEERFAAQYMATIERLEAAGYEHYEAASFARDGLRSQHNQQYWTHGEYLGLGPAAHGFEWQDEPVRSSNVRSIRKYVELLSAGQRPVDEEEVLAPEDLADERIMLRLRTSDGLNLRELRDRYGYDLQSKREDDVHGLLEAGYALLDGDHLKLTQHGRLFTDAIIGRLIS
ncbi:MAG: radical SAM family heme chaperone HemW [Bacteroidota bacterium]